MTKLSVLAPSYAYVRPQPCLTCKVRAQCLPDSTAPGNGLGRLMRKPHVLFRGEHLHRVDDAVRPRLYVIQSGLFKLYQPSADGRSSALGFYAVGEVLGLESIGLDHHRNSLVVLRDTVLCEFSYPQLIAASVDHPALARWLHQLLQAKLRKEQDANLMLCAYGAEQKLAGFIVQMLRANGAADMLELPMSRSDIADYLGLAPETVSRALKRLESWGYLAICKRTLQILDPGGLLASAAGTAAPLTSRRSA